MAAILSQPQCIPVVIAGNYCSEYIEMWKSQIIFAKDTQRRT